MTAFRHLLIVVIVFALPMVAWAGQIDPVCEKVLPVTAVNKVYGKQTIRLFGNGESHWANTTCNYGFADDKKAALTVTINPNLSDETYQKVYVNDPIYSAKRTPVSGLGDEAFNAGDLNNIVMTRKGKLFILLVSSSSIDKKTLKPSPTFSQDQLATWARQILKRYK